MRLMYTSILQRALTNRRVFIYIHLCTSVFFPSSRHLHENCYSLFSMLDLLMLNFSMLNLKIKIFRIIYLISRQLLLIGHFQFFFLVRLRVNIKQRRDNFCNSNIYCMYIYIFYLINDFSFVFTKNIVLQWYNTCTHTIFPKNKNLRSCTQN